MSKKREDVLLTCIVFSIFALTGYAVGAHRWFPAALCAVCCIVAGSWVLRRVRRADELESWVQRERIR